MHRKDILLLPEVQALLQRARDARTAAEFAAVNHDIETWVAEHADLYPKPRRRARRPASDGPRSGPPRRAAKERLSAPVIDRTVPSLAPPARARVPRPVGPPERPLHSPAVPYYRCPHCEEAVPMGHDESICRRLEDLLRRLETLAQPAGASGQPGHCLKVSEAARLVGISKSVIYGAIRRGELRVVRLGRSRRIRAAELDAWVADHETPAL